MSNWFLKNLDGSDIAKMLGRTFDLEITELNYHYFDEEDQQYVIFSAISNNKEPNLSLMGTVFKDHVSFSYRGKKADAGVFEALKYRVFKRINSNSSSVLVIGFSQRTFFPASKHSLACSKWYLTGVAI